jgi:hypothetical protein
MSKWKDSNVKIIHAFQGRYSDKYGLGDDGKLYCWDYIVGAWEKNWPVIDGPEEIS